MSARKPGTEGPKRPRLGMIGAVIVLLAVVYAAFVFFYRVI